MEPPKDDKSKKGKENKFEWAHEGVVTLVRVIILAMVGSVLTLNYVSIPGVPQKCRIDPTFIDRLYSQVHYTFGVQTAKKKDEESKKKPPETKET